MIAQKNTDKIPKIPKQENVENMAEKLLRELPQNCQKMSKSIANELQKALPKEFSMGLLSGLSLIFTLSKHLGFVKHVQNLAIFIVLWAILFENKLK